MNTFTINNQKYKAKSFDFNLICDLEDMGVAMQDMGDKPMSMVRAYFAICAGKGKEFAGNEMESHIIGGGSFDDIMNAMSDEMEKSDFFRSLNKAAETDSTKSAKKTTAKKSE